MYWDPCPVTWQRGEGLRTFRGLHAGVGDRLDTSAMNANGDVNVALQHRFPGVDQSHERESVVALPDRPAASHFEGKRHGYSSPTDLLLSFLLSFHFLLFLAGPGSPNAHIPPVVSFEPPRRLLLCIGPRKPVLSPRMF